MQYSWLEGLALPPDDAPLAPEAAVLYATHLNGVDELSEAVINRIQRFERFEKQWLPLSYFRAEESQEPVSASLVARYQAEPAASAPPILVEGVEHAIIDGFHRFNAAKWRGDEGLWAYVGCAPRPEWRPLSPPLGEEEPLVSPPLSRRRRPR